MLQNSAIDVMKSGYMTRQIAILITIALFIQCKLAVSQEDYSWWNKAHNWDGITSWTDYIIYSPYYLGPNALPVPESEKGFVKDRYEFRVGYESHISTGDKTQNLFLCLYIPLVKNIVAVEFYGVPIEHYKIDEKTVIERRIRNISGEGYAAGDFYFGTVIQILKDKKFPDVALRMSCRTASGSKLSNARFTDAPGYFFDISFGKNLLFNNKYFNKLRFHSMIGFYSWQMNLPNNRQNDAILFGLGVDLSIKKFLVSNALDGYIGYFGNQEVIVVNKDKPVLFKDRPVVYRLEITKESKVIDLILGYQLGIKNFPYQTIKFSLLFHLFKI